jgi:hypothetical protein
MGAVIDKEYKVTFVGDYFTTILIIQGVVKDEDEAIDLACNILMEQYGWDMKAVSTIDISAELAYDDDDEFDENKNDGWFDIGEIRI